MLHIQDVQLKDAGRYICLDPDGYLADTSLIVYQDTNVVQINITNYYSPKAGEACHDTRRNTFEVRMYMYFFTR